MAQHHDHMEGNTYEDSGIPQPYHLVQPSPWPLLGSVAGGLLATGMVLLMHKVTVAGMHIGMPTLILGFLALLSVMFVWWRDVRREAVDQRQHGPLVKLGFRYGMALFICSEVMFFVAFF